MNTQQQARALMMRHHKAIKNRQQSMLERVASEIGVDADVESWSHIQGKPAAHASQVYDRHGGAAS